LQETHGNHDDLPSACHDQQGPRLQQETLPLLRTALAQYRGVQKWEDHGRHVKNTRNMVYHVEYVINHGLSFHHVLHVSSLIEQFAYSINYCIFYQMYGRKYVVVVFFTAGQKRQSMGFGWI